MFNINWFTFVRFLLPIHKRKLIRIVWLDVMVSQVKRLWQTFSITINSHIYYLQFTGQIKWLEHVLNDRFDNIARGIYIDNIIDNRVVFFVFNKIEAQPKQYVYNKWNSMVPYNTGEYAAWDTRVWKYIGATPAANRRPDIFPSLWNDEGPRRYLYNKTEYYGGGDSFIVFVPAGVIFDTSEMKALINRYKLAGKTYSIQTY